MQINPNIPGKLTRIADGNVGAPRISGDGRSIVYTRWVDDQWDVERWRDGQIDHVSPDPHHDVEPKINADGSVIVWTRYTSKDGTDPEGNLDVMQQRDGVTTVLGKTRADEFEPDVSADGHVITWTYDDPTQRTGFDIQASVDGQQQDITTDWPVDNSSMVNQDGSRIFFRRKVKLDGGDLWMRDADGLHQITHNPDPEWDPAIDASGSTLLWSEDRTGHHQLFRYDVATDTKTMVAGEKRVDEMQAAANGDASLIAYVRHDHNVAAASPQIVLNDHGQDIPFTQDGWNERPSLSSDGSVLTWIAVEDDGQGGQTSVIYRFDRDVPPTTPTTPAPPPEPPTAPPPTPGSPPR